MKRGHWVFKVPDDLSDAIVSPINCALSEVIYGLNQIGVTLGDTVVIQGAGGLGLYATAVAREMGAGRIIVLDRLPARLALAREFGADDTLNVDEMDMKARIEFVLDHTGGVGADLVAEFVGSPRVLAEGIDMLRWGGRYLWIGNINLGFPTEIDPGNIVRCSKAIRGVIVYEPWVIPRALEFLSRTRDKHPFHKIISDTFAFTDINEAFTYAGAGSAIRGWAGVRCFGHVILVPNEISARSHEISDGGNSTLQNQGDIVANYNWCVFHRMIDYFGLTPFI